MHGNELYTRLEFKKWTNGKVDKQAQNDFIVHSI